MIKQAAYLVCKKNLINKLPSTTGIYFFVKGKKILYIGKSINIKARVFSHFENTKLDYKEKNLIDNSDKIAYLTVDSEFKSLLLESVLIKKYQPKYNVIWKDGKSFLYIKITIKEIYPKILLVRKENDNQSLYFGPFSSTKIVQEIIREIRKIIPFCTQKKISRVACFYSKIGLCSPCPNYINQIKDPFLKEKKLKDYRHNINQVVKLLNGNFEKVLKEYYSILKKLIQKENFEKAIEIREKIYKLEKLYHGHFYSSDNFLSEKGSQEKGLKNLKELLKNYFPNLKELKRIEAYDVSNLYLKEGTASMVVLTNGLTDKSSYRRFKIKNPHSKSDLEMLEEVFFRRFKQSWPKPNLIVVDGGILQVKLLKKILKKLKIEIPYIGIAKNPDRIIVGDQLLKTVKLSLNNPSFNLIRLLRDESHRFARKYHLYLRQKKLFK
ncbi:MAG: GIY-YIG nuclease family protein [Microgenomates group bacterium]|nr:GIY-YIG nuclease family protein [Microgenomates group bacterium]